MLPHCDAPEWPDGRPEGRFSSTIRVEDPHDARVALIGLADDTGVRMNHGRPGANGGPAAFRAALTRYGAASPPGWTWPAVYDAGDVRVGSSLTETHEWVTEAVRAALDLGLMPVCVGGGHDLTFPVVRALATAEDPVAVMYFDQHLDVRAEEGSGMPFRRIIEHGLAKELHVFGLHTLSADREHLRYFQGHGGRADQFGPEDPWPGRRTYVSLDLDVIDQSFAPGVSAMNPSGWTPALAEAWAEAAGRAPRVCGFDIMELSAQHDEHGRTARLAAHLFLAFLRGLSRRAED